jgi:hypothetical protein
MPTSLLVGTPGGRSGTGRLFSILLDIFHAAFCDAGEAEGRGRPPPHGSVRQADTVTEAGTEALPCSAQSMSMLAPGASAGV